MTEPHAATVLVVEDHDDLRDVLREAIDAIDGITVTGAARSAREALDLLASRHVDVAVIDMSLPDMSGDELIGHVRERAPATRCLVLSGHREPVYVARALSAGAHGYVLKGDPRELAASLRTIASGQSYLSPTLGDAPTD
jgi:DNA-binding NarL/FixJ family response regulator